MEPFGVADIGSGTDGRDGDIVSGGLCEAGYLIAAHSVGHGVGGGGRQGSVGDGDGEALGRDDGAILPTDDSRRTSHIADFDIVDGVAGGQGLAADGECIARSGVVIAVAVGVEPDGDSTLERDNIKGVLTGIGAQHTSSSACSLVNGKLAIGGGSGIGMIATTDADGLGVVGGIDHKDGVLAIGIVAVQTPIVNNGAAAHGDGVAGAGRHHIEVGTGGVGSLPIAARARAEGADIEVVGDRVCKTGNGDGRHSDSDCIGRNRVGIESLGAVDHLPRRAEGVGPCQAHLARGGAGGDQILGIGTRVDFADGDIVDINIVVATRKFAVDNKSGIVSIEMAERNGILSPGCGHSERIDPHGTGGHRVKIGDIANSHLHTGIAGFASPELGFDGVDGLFDTRRCDGDVGAVVVMIQSVAAASGAGADGGIAA